MGFFRVYLSGTTPPPAARPPSRDCALEPQYRSYLAHPDWLPAPPVQVALTGPRGRRLPVGTDWHEAYELSLFASGQRASRRVPRMATALAAAAAVFVPLASVAEAAERPETVPPAIHVQAVDRGMPPTVSLVGEKRAEPRGMVPVLDEKGRPVLLGSFHSNVSGMPHQNSPHVHTNAPPWANHANTYSPHANTWTNHTNVPTYVIPHTNITPGDFIF